MHDGVFCITFTRALSYSADLNPMLVLRSQELLLMAEAWYILEYTAFCDFCRKTQQRRSMRLLLMNSSMENVWRREREMREKLVNSNYSYTRYEQISPGC